MNKPTHYLWRSDFSSEQEWEAERSRYTAAGFRTVTFLDGPPDRELLAGMKALIRNHRNGRQEEL